MNPIAKEQQNKDARVNAMTLKLQYGIAYQISENYPVEYLLPRDKLPICFVSGEVKFFRALNRKERRKIQKERRR